MTETETKWRERVAAWRASGETADAFAESGGFEPTTLRYWASRLKSRRAAVPASTRAGVPMARVVRRRKPTAPASPQPEPAGELVVAVGDARIVVGPNFDPVLLRDVVAALGGKT